MNSIKVEIDQEWQKLDSSRVNPNFIILISGIDKHQNWAYQLWPDDRTFMRLSYDMTPLFNHWKFICKAIRCDKCNDFCKQNCNNQ